MSRRPRKIRLFALSTCPACKRTKKYLDERGIDYDVVFVDTLDSGEQWVVMKEVRRYNPDATFPTTVIEDVIVGYDLAELEKALAGR